MDESVSPPPDGPSGVPEDGPGAPPDDAPNDDEFDEDLDDADPGDEVDPDAAADEVDLDDEVEDDADDEGDDLDDLDDEFDDGAIDDDLDDDDLDDDLDAEGEGDLAHAGEDLAPGPAGEVAEHHDETEFATVASAPTIEGAKKKALEQLRKVVPFVREDDVEFVVVEEGGKGGFLGMGKSQPRVEARVLPGGPEGPGDAVDLREASDKLGEFVARVALGMGLDVEVEVSVAGDALVAEVAGGELGLLIGRHGQTLDAVQYLAAIVVNGHSHSRRQVIVDAEGYRGRREVSIRSVADRAAQKVERTRNEVTLKPMTAAERKIVHLYLKDHPKVETRSEGDEPQRAVIISPKRR